MNNVLRNHTSADPLHTGAVSGTGYGNNLDVPLSTLLAAVRSAAVA